MRIEENRVYTADEVAEIFRVDRHRVYGWIRSGWLRGFTVAPEARQYLVRGAAILELVEKMENHEWME